MTREALIKSLGTDLPAISKRIMSERDTPASAVLALSGARRTPMEDVAAAVLDAIERAGCTITLPVS